MNPRQRPWTVVIFACRESLPQLLQTLDAARVSAASCAVIHVLINGNQTLANALVHDLTQRQINATEDDDRPAIKVWSIPLGDKANAWNQAIHQLWTGEEIAFFIDGYVRLNPDAVDLLGNAVVANIQALAGTGVPTMGRSAKALRENMLINTGFHGNFCCIKGDILRQMREQHIRLPIGLYRTDALMGAILSYALDPTHHAWEDYRIHVHPSASWQIDVARWWRPKDVRAYLKRYFRQIRGKIENAAFADHMANRRCSPASFPTTVQEMVLKWVRDCPDDFKGLAQRNPFVHHALKSFQLHQMDAAGDLRPHRVWQHEPKRPI